MDIERMEHGISVLRQVIIRQLPFYMGDWITEYGSPYDCSTAACAAGWMCRDPWMKAQGLEYDEEPYYEGHWGYGAMAKFFEISDDQVNFLFAPSFYPLGPINDITPDMVLNRMRAVLAAKVNVVETVAA